MNNQLRATMVGRFGSMDVSIGQIDHLGHQYPGLHSNNRISFCTTASMMCILQYHTTKRALSRAQALHAQSHRIWTRFFAQKKKGKANRPKTSRPVIYPKELEALRVHHDLLAWKNNPAPPEMNDLIPHLVDFIKGTWLENYPEGANLRKLQRDIAFRMPLHRPGKIPREMLMPILGHLEQQGVVTVRIKVNGNCLIYRPGSSRSDEEEHVAQMDALRKAKLHKLLSTYQDDPNFEESLKQLEATMEANFPSNDAKSSTPNHREGE
jgi:hypothetical protein